MVQGVTVRGSTNWGQWGEMLLCAHGVRVAGYRLQVQDPVPDDDSALNGIQLACADGTVTKKAVGPYGEWKQWKYCEGSLKLFASKYIVAFKLRSETDQGTVDDTAANNVNFLCNDETELIGTGLSWGKWESNDYESCSNGNYFCGVQASIEEDQFEGDDTGLNKMSFLCCDPKRSSK